jgi:hypothetical protein
VVQIHPSRVWTGRDGQPPSGGSGPNRSLKHHEAHRAVRVPQRRCLLTQTASLGNAGNSLLRDPGRSLGDTNPVTTGGSQLTHSTTDLPPSEGGNLMRKHRGSLDALDALVQWERGIGFNDLNHRPSSHERSERPKSLHQVSAEGETVDWD